MRMPYIGGRGPDYTTKLNLMYNWQADGKLEGSRDDAHSGGECRPRKTRPGRNSRGWRGSRTSTGADERSPADAQGRVVRGVTSTQHTTIHALQSAICRGRSPPATKVARDYWRLGETAHLPEVSLFERFLSRARGVRPNRSTRTRRGLARRGGPTYSVAVLFGTFGGAPFRIYTTAGDNLPPTLSAGGYGRERGCPI